MPEHGPTRRTNDLVHLFDAQGTVVLVRPLSALETAKNRTAPRNSARSHVRAIKTLGAAVMTVEPADEPGGRIT